MILDGDNFVIFFSPPIFVHYMLTPVLGVVVGEIITITDFVHIVLCAIAGSGWRRKSGSNR